MPQDTRNTSDVQMTTTYSTANIDSLLTSFDAGDIITADAVNLMLTYWARLSTHDHGITDFVTKDTFGNTSGDQSNSSNHNTDQPKNTPLLPAFVSQGQTVLATKHNQIKDAHNFFRTHVHNGSDD